MQKFQKRVFLVILIALALAGCAIAIRYFNFIANFIY